MVIQAGKLRHRIRVFDFTVARDPSSNQEVRTPVLQATVWCQIENKAANEREVAGQVESIAGYTILMRQITVKNDSYFEWDDPTSGLTRTFNPIGKDRPAMKRGQVFFDCVEVQQ